MNKRNHILRIITPSGEGYALGFLSPCRDGFVLGTPEIEGVETSHLTVIHKKGSISAHITSQTGQEKRRFFPPVSKAELCERYKSLIDANHVFLLTKNQLAEDVLYFTERFLDWLDLLFSALYRKEVSKNEVVHILDFKNLLNEIPQLIDQLKESPYLFLGVCKAQDILADKSKVLGVNNARLLIIAHENQLYGVDFSHFMNFDFTPTLSEQEISNPTIEISRSLGITQYIAEIEGKKFFEKLLSKNTSIKG